MDLFPISQLEMFSGIKSHTIRMWEKRYRALKPGRSEGNTRYYDNTQLRRLLNIVSLMGDHKVSDLCRMKDEELFGLVAQAGSNVLDATEEYFVSQLILAGMGFDEELFTSIFSHCLLRYGMKDAYIKVIYPMLKRVGVLWSCDSMPPGHEHFITNLVRQKLTTAIDLLPPPKDSDPWLLFLPENEFHDIGLLFAHYLLKVSGKKVYYLGGNVPFDSLKSAVKATNCQNILFFMVHRDSAENINAYLKTLVRAFRGKNIFVAGDCGPGGTVPNERNVRWLQSVKDFVGYLQISC